MVSDSTLKILFALSGNVCAFPGCTAPIVDTEHGVVTGQICHIKARRKQGPRYDANQPTSERNGYENLILMCSAHNKIVDDPSTGDAFTVEILQGYKREHELRFHNTVVKPDLLSRFIQSVGLKEGVRDYYKFQEDVCEQVPLTIWRRPMKGSEVFVQPSLIVERIKHDDTGIFEDDHSKSYSDNRSNEVLGHNNRARNETESERLSAAQPPVKTLGKSSWESVFRRDGLRLLFVGDAGSGKSFSLTQEVRQRLADARTQLESPDCDLWELSLPLIVRATTLVEKEGPAADALLQCLADPSLASSSGFYNWWHQAFASEKGRRLFIVIDGLDEIGEGRNERFVELMKELDRLESASLIVSCRTMYLAERQRWIAWVRQPAKVIGVAPLEEEQQTALIEKRLGDRAGELMVALKKKHALRLLCRSPLILTWVCSLYLSGESSKDLTYSFLYDKVIAKLLRGDWRDENHRPKWTRSENETRYDQILQQRRAEISKIVWYLFQTSRSRNRFTGSDWGEAYDLALAAGGDLQVGAQELWDEMKLVGLITASDSAVDGSNPAPSDPNDKYYSFVHRTILEYFAVRGLSLQNPDWINTLTKHMWCESDWDKLITFAPSVAGNSTILLRRIAKETGATSTAEPLLATLSVFCSIATTLSMLALLIIGGVAAAQISASRNASDRERAYLKQLVESFRTTSVSEITGQPVKTIVARLTDLDQCYKQTEQVFQTSVLRETGPSAESKRWLAPWLGFLFPRLAWVVLPLLLGALLFRLANFVLYRITVPPQDDIFRTGLRLQAEILGLNNNVSEKESKRVVSELLASEKAESSNIDGASEEGGIPEDLLLLVGSNDHARQALSNHWKKIVAHRRKQLLKRNRRLRRILSTCHWTSEMFGRHDREALLIASDLRNVWQLAEALGPNGHKFARHLRKEMAKDFQQALEWRTIKLTETQLRDRLVSEFNTLIGGASCFQPALLEGVSLRLETVALIEQTPEGEDLVRLNRLLLEDQFRPQIRKLRSVWVRFAGWWIWQFVKTTLLTRMYELGELSPESSLSLALRGLSLLPSEDNRQTLMDLLDEIATTRNYLVRAGKSTMTFGRLEVMLAKALVRIGDPRDNDRLVELANRRPEGNRHTIFAVQELAKVDPRRGIAAAAKCLLEGWQANGDHRREAEFLDVLSAQPHEAVLSELIQMSEKEPEIFHRVMRPWLERLSSYEIAKESLERVVTQAANTHLSDAAQKTLDRSHEYAWLDAPAWLDHCAKEIAKKVRAGLTVEAAKLFDVSISSYYFDYNSESVSKSLDRVASACNESVLDSWFEENFHLLSIRCTGMGAVGKQPSGRVVEQALIKRAGRLDFDHIDGEGFGQKTSILQALGELGTKEAGATLIEILTRTRHVSSRIHRRLNDNSYDRGLFFVLLIASLGKMGDEARFELIREAQYPRTWLSYYIAARSLAKVDAQKALKLLLLGTVQRGNHEPWKPEYGPEPGLLSLAQSCGARIMKVTYDGYQRYWVTSRSRRFRFVVRA